MEQSHVISERVFVSSKHIQFIGVSSMDSLLNAIDFEKRDHLPVVEPPLQPSSPQMHNSTSNEKPTREPRGAMSIESLLMDGQPSVVDVEKRRRRQDTTTASSSPDSTRDVATYDKENEDDDNDQHRVTKIRRLNDTTSHHKALPGPAQQRMMTITCYHASVAQKSYGSEKRFLCPPPLVSIHSGGRDTSSSSSSTQPLVSMAVMCESGDRFLEQKIQLGDTRRGSFKYLHVTGTAKAKQFHLRVSLQHTTTTTAHQQHIGSSPKNNHHMATTTTISSSVAGSPPPPLPSSQPYVTFFSNPISIISKPSKKTSKARNVSTCILANSPVSLYNRINSQTVRTKYMSTEHGHMCAKSASWSPFEIVVLRQPSGDEDASPINDEVMNPQTTAYASTVNYGSVILLRDMQTGVESPPMIIRKVDKGTVLGAATGPVSQMQKVALQLATTARSDDQSMYLLATGQPVTPPVNQEDPNSNAATWLDFVASRRVVGKPDQGPVEHVDDYLCWTIVGIAKFEYHYHEPPPPSSIAVVDAPTTTPSPAAAVATTMPTSPPPSPSRRIIPLPLIVHVAYHSRQNILTLTGQHLFQPTTGRLFEIRLGQQQKDALRVLDQQSFVDEDDPKKATLIRLVLDLPPTQDLLVAHHNVLVTRPDGSRYFELPLVLARQDGSSFTFGKALACDILPNGDASPWFVVNTATTTSAVASPSP